MIHYKLFLGLTVALFLAKADCHHSPFTIYFFSHYESMVKSGSKLYEYVEKTITESSLPEKSKKASTYESTTMFLGHLLQYLGEIILLLVSE